MKKLLTITITTVLTALLLTGVAYANDWLSFDSESKADKTEENIEELLEIALNYKEGKISADDAVADLSDKLMKATAKNDDLKQEIKDLKAEIENNKGDKKYTEHLEKELKKANKATNNTFDRSEKALNKAKQ